ncbi:Hypothetical predicted protein [Octopus vulgaris]|uniref:Uncharacterized protein n=1 Tax=Octopus vulgaris TaxID=6645 RepID=A0AA36AK25_OCTVU|nr:Hypothetical predicted protein [Octopus vulgaris]
MCPEGLEVDTSGELPDEADNSGDKVVSVTKEIMINIYNIIDKFSFCIAFSPWAQSRIPLSVGFKVKIFA